MNKLILFVPHSFCNASVEQRQIMEMHIEDRMAEQKPITTEFWNDMARILNKIGPGNKTPKAWQQV